MALQEFPQGATAHQLSVKLNLSVQELTLVLNELNNENKVEFLTLFLWGDKV